LQIKKEELAMLRELDTTEQQKMTVNEAGRIYNGHFIFFTDSGGLTNEDDEIYAVPRVISLTEQDFLQSGLYEKYRDRNKYGVPLFCPFFMAEENIPPVLSF
jgi:hypothetical protein